MELNKDNITQLNGGLHSDNSLLGQPKNTYKFALNTVNETNEGDESFRSNEESNEACIAFPEDFIPIGKEYIGNNEVIVFLVRKDNAVSEIGILKDSCIYETHVNDEESEQEDKLGFTVEHQIDAVYRLRRGCERTVYFTDNNQKPRYYNFDKPQNFKNSDDTWAGKKFNLFREYNSIPEFSSIEVLDSGGLIEPGSVNIAIRHLDEGLNPLEWITTSSVINIYNDLSTEDFLKINGSINSALDYIDFPVTSKAIKVEFDNLDESYPFYQLAFIHASSGNGLVNEVKYTEIIPSTKNFFIYTSENVISSGTEEEILFFNDIIYKASSIESIENRLVLADTQGKQVNFCKLQKYASRIKADVVTKKIFTNQLDDPRNTKNPTVHFGDMTTGGTGYMPGEIYSFGIVYVFDDGSISPVYHIPGKNPDIDITTVFSPDENTYPMDINNESVNNTYIDNDSCGNNDYWGLDSEGISLEGKPVRHHRFPLRSAINLPLVTEEESEGEQSFPYYAVQLTGVGNITLPVVCTQEEIDDMTCTPVDAPPFQARVTYTVDGVEETMVVNIDPANEASPADILRTSNLYTSDNIVIIKVEEANEDGVVTDVTIGTSPKGLVYTATVVNSTITTEGKIYSTEILGIKFSGVDIPDMNDSNGEIIVGYYIVRNERIENEKTILDSAVLIPTLENNKYISHGLLAPEVKDTTKINKTLFGVIHPEHKFNKKEYNNFDYIKQEGNFGIIKRNYSKTSYNDVFDGSSYDSGIHKRGNDDGHKPNGEPDTRGFDGFSLTAIMRDNYLSYKIKTLFNVLKINVKEIFYLKALESRDINDGANTAYNISCDNKIGMIQLENDEINPIENNLPYVIIGRNILDSYSNFRILPYYKDSLNIEKFNEFGVGTATIFNGDTYVCPMRYTSTVFWDNRLALRESKRSVWNYVVGAILVIVGTVLTFFTAGASTLVVGAGLSILGGGTLFLSSGIERDAMVKAYTEEYKKGLKKTALDDWVNAFYNFKNNFYTQLFGFTGNGSDGRTGPSDDEIEWIGDCLTDLWFESTINISLRHKMVSDVPTFLDAPGIIESGNNSKIRTWEFFGSLYTNNNPSRYPISKLDYHINKKLLTYNAERNDSREYIGAPLGEYYEVNPDYHRKNKQKIYYHLPIDYDCCIECVEDFPHRWHWSEQSFQEELTDNYRIFLPNNYKDLDGETGRITNVFKIGNDLFMHTEEALWQIPRNYQERVTDQIVSFIGTGSYGEIPARKVIDDDTGNSAGSNHKWGMIKTPNGVFFPSENQKKIFQFDGRQLKPISSSGISKWFQNNMELLGNKQYYNSTGRKYLYNDNTSNPFGTGYISTYDSQKERIIFTKKDYVFNNLFSDLDYEICVNNGQVTYFENYNQTIETYENNGWEFNGVEDCKMKFQRIINKTRTESRQVVVNVSPEAIIIPFFDTTSMGTDIIDNVSATLDSWFPGFKASVNGGDNNITFLNPGTWNRWGTENWVKDPAQLVINNVGTDLDVILLVFVDESADIFHGGTITVPMTVPTESYVSSVNNFVDNLYPQFASFLAINYPIVRDNAKCKEYLIHAIGAIEATNLTVPEVEALEQNPFFTTPEWDDLKLVLQSNSYTGQPILKNYGWLYKENRVTGIGNNTTPGCPSDGVSVITPCTFTEDIENLLSSSTSTETIEVEVTYQDNEFEYIEGVIIEEPVNENNSWTISYSLKQNNWISWHSYLPNFYLNVPEKFYSWIYGNDNLWKHNVQGSYQIFYGNLHPFILEYVSLSNPLATRIWEYLIMLVEVKKYNPEFEEFFDINNKFFNKLIAYNSRQCSGLMNIKVKDANPDNEDYLLEQVVNSNDEIIVDRNERNWTINNLRDIRTNYNEPIFISKLSSLQSEYFIDKILNNNSVDYEKEWSELESFRDKYLVIRLIFDNFAEDESEVEGSTKMIMNFSGENETQSFR